jgi:pyruvate kinase
MRKTKIVGTIGPASSSEERIEALIASGLNVARLNFSHGTQEQHAAACALVRRVSQRLGVSVAVLQDLQGPKIRTGKLAGGQPVELHDGARFTITNRPQTGDASIVSTTYPALPTDVAPGDRILLADGLMELRVVETNATDVICTVVHGGWLGESKGINLPGVAVSAPSLTEKDLDDLAFGVSLGVDYIALSFVRSADDVRAAKVAIAARGAAIPVIAKLEKPEALDHLSEILTVSDGVMVARGDMGVEMPLEKVPLAQKMIIREANQRGVLVITATQMLESMISNPRPTRAEASDVANAILDGTDAVMLSGEMAVGQFPVEAVRVMDRIALEVEAGCGDIYQIGAGGRAHSPDAEVISEAARTIAEYSDIAAIVAFTSSGLTARLISKDRPCSDILALTPNEAVYHRLALLWGVTPLLCPVAHDIEQLLAEMQRIVLATGRLAHGDKVVVMGSMPLGLGNPTNFLKIHEL